MFAEFILYLYKKITSFTSKWCKHVQLLSGSHCKATLLSPQNSFISGDLEIYRIPNNIFLSFEGWDPISWSTDREIFFAGLPSFCPAKKKIIIYSSNRRELSDQVVYFPNEQIDWKHFFERLEKIYDENVEFVSDME